MIPLVEKRNYFLGFSAVLVLASVVAVALFGLRQGIDLRGGTQWSVVMTDTSVTEEAVRAALKGAIPGHEVQVKRAGDGGMLIRLPSITPDEHDRYGDALQDLGC